MEEINVYWNDKFLGRLTEYKITDISNYKKFDFKIINNFPLNIFQIEISNYGKILIDYNKGKSLIVLEGELILKQRKFDSNVYTINSNIEDHFTFLGELLSDIKENYYDNENWNKIVNNKFNKTTFKIPKKEII
jgi:hypothetical protein